ncbi:SRPBCC family protein [Ohtaekwangia sp.]|uniref:SRPBCC family protein n=1 Tax=Ohtaekwangia sp. TaxID=2066019 RepID=UPI002F95189B
MATKNESNNDMAARSVVITRILQAPRELVFEAWTDPQHLLQWWGPKGFTNTFLEYDLRVGGQWRFVMHGPDGVDYPNLIVFKEIAKPERLAYTHGSGDPNDASQFEVVVTFEELGDKTRLTMNSIFPTREARDFVVREFHAIEGGNQTVDRLEERLALMTGENVAQR